MQVIVVFLKILRRFLRAPKAHIESMTTVLLLRRKIRAERIGVLFYDRFAVHGGFTGPVLAEYDKYKQPYIYLVGDSAHERLISGGNQKNVYFIDNRCEIYFRFLPVGLMITPASNFEVHAKNSATKLAHLFHSPVSMHYVYGDDAFDAYDIYFAVGPHHVREIETLTKLRGWPERTVYKSGYPKIDEIHGAYKRSHIQDKENVVTKIAFAPSWGDTNILRSHGVKIVGELIDQGYEVLVRPHKHSFDYDQDVLKEMAGRFKGKSLFLDRESGFKNVYACDVLVSDWSGIAYEYVFATERPVVFVEVEGGQKIQSVYNRKIPLKAMEDVCRHGVGMVVSEDNVASAIDNLLSNSPEEWADKIGTTRDQYIFNFRCSAATIARDLIELVAKRKVDLYGQID
jgi:hypothetical protein